ncbi:MAG: hypothetical protein AAB401_06720, partial [Acidobacteriota bacterium]
MKAIRHPAFGRLRKSNDRSENDKNNPQPLTLSEKELRSKEKNMTNRTKQNLFTMMATLFVTLLLTS